LLLILALGLAGVALPILSQRKPTPYRYDTVKLKAHYLLQLPRATYFYNRDTILALPDTLKYSIISKQQLLRTQAMYDSLQEKMSRRRVTGWLYDIVFARTSEGFNTELSQSQQSDSPYKLYAGKEIRRVIIKRLDPFGTSILDTNQYSPNILERLANRLHILTQSRLIRQNILQKEGDKTNPSLLADSERLLRKLPFLQDARIFLSPSDDGTVDLVVVTKDLYSITAQGSLNGITSAEGGIADNNFLGLGQRFGADVFFTPQQKITWGYGFHHQIENIRGSFVKSQIDYVKNYQINTLNFQLYKPFYSPSTRYGGGLQLNQTSRTDEFTPIGADTSIKFYNTSQTADLWIGRSFVLADWKAGESNYLIRRNVVVAGRIIRKNFPERPEVKRDSNQLYHNFTMGLASISFTGRSYYKSGLIFGFGRTEDIPVGRLIQFTAGWSAGEFYNRTYFGISFRQGVLLKNGGYIQPEVSMGGFWHKGLAEQGVFNIKVNSFSPITKWHQYKARHFFQFNYLSGINRLNTELVSLNDRNGIRGLSSNMLRGNQKLVFNLDNYIFTPWYLYGFRFVVDPFVDLGWISNQKQLFKANQFYAGIGLGVKFRNENLVFQTFVVRLAYYPIVPQKVFPVSFILSNESRIDFTDFDSKAPAVIGYQ
jgi:hypothetical protein